MRSLFITALALLLAAPFVAAGEPAAPPLLRLRAFAVNMNNRTKTRTVDLVIERWSTPEEQAGLKATLQQKGAAGLLPALQRIRPRCGFVRTTGTLGWDLYYAREEALPDGGRRIVFGSDRPVAMYERQNATRTEEYAFSLGEIRLGKDGKGEGKVIPAAKVGVDPKTGGLEIIGYQAMPTRLNKVEVLPSEPAK
jgi:hypothetical protein